MRITFDSNVWEKILRPERSHGDDAVQRDAFAQLREALVRKRVSGFIAESYFTIEAMTKPQRAAFLASRSVTPQVLDAVLPDGTETRMVVAVPDESHRPPLPAKVLEILDDAMAIGLRIMSHPRFQSFSLEADWYVPVTEEISERTVEASGAIEGKGLGRGRLRAYSRELAGRHMNVKPFFDVPDVPMAAQEAKKIAALAAEWADGEAVACHIGFSNDVFCTQDCARNASKPSVLDRDHRRWLLDRYGTRIASVEELAAELARP